MIVGFEVDNLLKNTNIQIIMIFFLPNKEIKKVKIAKVLEKRVKYYIKRYYYFRYKSCKRYFGYKQRFFQQILLLMFPNELERANIKQKLQRLDLDLNIIQKKIS